MRLHFTVKNLPVVMMVITYIIPELYTVYTRSLLRLERTMNLLEGGERGWGGDMGGEGEGGE